MSTDSPFPELKKTHTMSRIGRPWRDIKPPPSAPVWAVVQGFASYWALVAAIDLGVFDAVERLGSADSATLAEELGVSALHLRHMCDVLVTLDFLDQIHGEYELTETAERYLCTNGAASMATLIRVAPGPHGNWEQLVETVRNGAVTHPIERDPVAFYLPLVEATFVTQYRAATRLGMRLGWRRQPALRVLDIGAGLAPWAIALLEQSVGSSAMINDLEGVLARTREVIEERGLSDRVAFAPGDFHDIDVGTDAFDVVVLGHVCRAEGEHGATSLVAKAMRALRPGGTLLLADYFADGDRKYNTFGVQMGLTMVANTLLGGALTTDQVVGWLRVAGFRSIRLLEPIGFTFVYVATKPTNPSTQLYEGTHR